MHREWDPRTLAADTRPSRIFAAALIGVYIVLTLTVALHHEPWRDEADSWLYARDASFGTIIARTRYVGFPAVWFLLLAIPAKLGMPYVSMTILHVAIAAASIAILALYAPLSYLTKLLVALSYFFSYEYSVVARSYSTSILLAFVAAALFDKRREHPIAFAVVVALLFNVNAQGFAIAAALAVLYGIDRRATPIMALAAIAAFLQVRTPADHARMTSLHAPMPENFQWGVGNAFLPTMPPIGGFIAGMLVLLTITLAIRKSREGLLVLWMPVAAISILYVYIWIGGLRHAGFYLIAVLLAVWLGARRLEPRYARVAALLLNATLLVSCFTAARFWVLDVRSNFSGSREMAQFIRINGLERYEIAAHNLTQCEAVLPYLPRKQFWYAGLGRYGTYMTWDAAFERALDVPYPVAEARARQQFAGRQWLLLFNVEMPDPAAHGFRLLYANRGPIFEKTDERYWLYAPLR